MARVCLHIAAAMAALTLVAAVPYAAADNNVIILRLEDDRRSAGAAERSPEQAPDSEARPAPALPEGSRLVEGGPVIDVPAVSKRPAPLPDVSKAASALVMDADTGQVLFAKNPNTRRPNASTTKIMTAILTIENLGMDEWVTASKKACQTPYTSLNLRPGERIQVRDLLHGLLIRSANDAAVALAEHIGGSVSSFAGMMNRRAREIGCTNTNFVTPNGLYAEGHYSSAHDLCLMARHALRYPVFNEIITTRKWILNSRTINRKDLAVFAKHRFMKSYPGADGVKSGYLKQAGYCYVGSATHDGWRLVSAVLKSDDSSRDTAALMNYGFGNFRPYVVARSGAVCAGVRIDGGASETVSAAPVRDIKVIVPRTGARITTTLQSKPLEAPISKGASVGTMIVVVNGKPVGSVELLAAEDVGISIARRAWWVAKTCGLLLAGCWGIGYGTAFAKGSRRRRRRVTTPLRGTDRYR